MFSYLEYGDSKEGETNNGHPVSLSANYNTFLDFKHTHNVNIWRGDKFLGIYQWFFFEGEAYLLILLHHF